jgi:hypothetical protein
MPKSKPASKSGPTFARTVAPFAPLALALLMTNAVAPGSKAESGDPGTAGTVAAAKCEDVLNFQDCHSRYPTGCSPSGSYDAYLNLLKNQLAENPPAVQTLSPADYARLDAGVPKDLGRSNHSDFKDQLSALGEGRTFSVVAYLYYARPSGKESSNCELDDKAGADVDFHIGIGFDPKVAEQIRTKDKSLSPKVVSQTGYIVEMTPEYRSLYGGPGWTVENLTASLGRQVRVTGQLMLDNEHNVSGQNCAVTPNPSNSKCWRASVWELHPVTKFEVCNADTCTPDATTGWAELGESAGQSSTTASASHRPKGGSKTP